MTLVELVVNCGCVTLVSLVGALAWASGGAGDAGNPFAVMLMGCCAFWLVMGLATLATLVSEHAWRRTFRARLEKHFVDQSAQTTTSADWHPLRDRLAIGQVVTGRVVMHGTPEGLRRIPVIDIGSSVPAIAWGCFGTGNVPAVGETVSCAITGFRGGMIRVGSPGSAAHARDFELDAIYGTVNHDWRSDERIRVALPDWLQRPGDEAPAARLLEPSPVWSVFANRWPADGLCLVRDRECLIAPTICVERESGDVRWRQRQRRPNHVVGIVDDIIVATERRGVRRFGVWGISRTTGDLRWTSHGDGFAGRLLRALDFLPGYVARDAPAKLPHQPDQTVYCSSGRVLDPATGVCLRTERPSTPLWRPMLTDKRAMGDSDLLFLNAAPDRRHAWATRISRDDDLLWQTLIAGGEWHYIDSLTAGRWLHVLVADGPAYERQGWRGVARPARHRLRTFDLVTGEPLLDCELTKMPRTDGRIELADHDWLIVSFDRRELRAFRWQ